MSHTEVKDGDGSNRSTLDGLWDLDPLCVGPCPCLERKHMHVLIYTCSVGFPLTCAEVFSMCHSGNLEQVNPVIPALHLEHHRQPCLSS